MSKPWEANLAIGTSFVLVLQLVTAGPLVRVGYSQARGPGALEFDGVNEYVTLGNPPSLQLSGDMSVCAWVKLAENTSGRSMGIVGKLTKNYGTSKGFSLVRHSSNRFRFRIGIGTPNLYSAPGANVYADSEWHHVAGVLQGGVMRIYEDGVAHQASWSNLQLADSGGDACVGKECADVDTEFFEGLIDEVCCYDRALSSQEVQSALFGRSLMSGPSLVGYWSFDETSGQTVLDHSDRGNKGYLGSSAMADSSDPQRVEDTDGSELPCQDEWSHLLTFNSPADMAYLTTNNGEHNYGGAIPVQRVTNQQPDPFGVLRMQNLQDLSWRSPTFGYVIPARATFTFDDRLCWPYPPAQSYARIEIWISFDYLFLSEQGALTVRASNGVGDKRMDSLVAPDSGSPGAGSSMAWGVYRRQLLISYAPSGENTIRLTLELKGPLDTGIFINDLRVSAALSDEPLSIIFPRLSCEKSLRGDIAGDPDVYSIGPEDFLAAVYYCGRETPWCMDSPFTEDGTMSPEDAEYYDWVTGDGGLPAMIPSDNVQSISAQGASATVRPADAYGCSPDAPIIVAGKAYRYTPDGRNEFLSDRLFGFNTSHQPQGEPCTWGKDRLNTRIVKDGQGRLYQLNAADGLVRLSDGRSVLPCGTLLYDENSAWVDVGWIEEYESPPIQDVAFDASGDVYVVPVQVTRANEAPYRAAARIRLGAYPSNNSVVMLYETEPLYPTGVHEIEVYGSQVYVLDKRKWEDSVLHRYDRNSGIRTRREELPTGYRPAAFHVSPRDGQICIADCAFYSTSLHFLDPLIFTEMKEVDVQSLDHVTDIAEEPGTGTLWLAGFSIPSMPTDSDIEDGNTIYDEPAFKPFLAKVPRSSAGPIDAVCVSEYRLVGELYLSLPLSIVCTGNSP